MAPRQGLSFSPQRARGERQAPVLREQASCCAAIAKRWRAKGMIQFHGCCSGITRNRPTPC